MTLETYLLAAIALFTFLHWAEGSPWAQLRKRRTKRFVLRLFGKEYRG